MKIERPLVDVGVVEKGLITSIAMNTYHNGKEGLAQHFDNAVRFKQSIYTVKLDSDSILSFGNQFYGYLNGAFFFLVREVLYACWKSFAMLLTL